MLLNKKEVRGYMLEQLKILRPGWGASRISDRVYLELDLWLRERIKSGLHKHPSIGKTVMELK